MAMLVFSYPWISSILIEIIVISDHCQHTLLPRQKKSQVFLKSCIFTFIKIKINEQYLYRKQSVKAINVGNLLKTNNV